MKKIFLLIFVSLICWSFYPKGEGDIVLALAGCTFKASPIKVEIFGYNLIGYSVIGSSRITFDNEEYFTYRSCSTSKPLKGKWRISQDTLFLEGEHRLFPFYFVIKNDNKMVHKGKLRSGPFIEIMRRE